MLYKNSPKSFHVKNIKKVMVTTENSKNGNKSIMV